MEGAEERSCTSISAAGASGDHGHRCSRPDDGTVEVFALLGKRWTGLLIAALLKGPGFFSELHRAVPGISERMLADRLAELSALGLLVRIVDDGPPVRVSYRLTDAGRALGPAMAELSQWARSHLAGTRAPGPRRDA
ncbi:winged helix-turn-helix transcriptional regulator [Streptomyces fuscigenes]|uniref:winged helix-turn-helix transcriptional regulator n=1 Tax=Streptomyces fuscigenes TaxID=1528880 RepID=UPI001F29583C|nr:helix-turn-helix domain-containing protein [Streptomyces fuscigenes]MCF3960860.1 helix-turn-helix transcriptional regulator [Streptomyces fuscigenes]